MKYFLNRCTVRSVIAVPHYIVYTVKLVILAAIVFNVLAKTGEKLFLTDF